jgi:hypothetical protein
MTMMASPNRALRRAPMLAAAAAGLLVLGGLTANGLSRDVPDEPAAAERLVAAHADAPPQSLAFTADFFEAMGLDERTEPAETPQPATAGAVPAPCSVMMAQEETARTAPRETEVAATRPAADAIPDSAALTTASTRSPVPPTGRI